MSIVVATTEPWPAARPCLEPLLAQAAEGGVEILVGDSDGAGLPADLGADRGVVRHLPRPGASVFALRAEATAAARGEVVAWTEDHCVPAADWVAAVRAAHGERPAAPAIGGAVENGSRRRTIDWANYLLTFAPFLPPIDGARMERVPSVANASFRRDALPCGPLAIGFLEFHWLPRLQREGRLAFDDRMSVAHVQSMGWIGTPRAHFHNGRSTAGLALPGMDERERRRRIRRCFVLPKEILRTSLAALRGRRELRRRVLVSLPAMVLLATSHALGEWIALVRRSAGRSPERLL